MGYRRVPFAEGEWYHCYSRGIDKRIVFESQKEFERFIELLYLANDTKPIDRASMRNLSHKEILQLPRENLLVAIGAYCLMDNHFHLLLQEKVPNGISKFMHKVGTGYTRYFNLKHERVGNLFTKPFRSKHISDDRYFKKVISYIHLNPAEIIERGWKQGKINNLSLLKKKLLAYPYASTIDFSQSEATPRIQAGLLDTEAVSMLKEDTPQIGDSIEEALAYYQDLPKEFQ